MVVFFWDEILGDDKHWVGWDLNALRLVNSVESNFKPRSVAESLVVVRVRRPFVDARARSLWGRSRPAWGGGGNYIV